jgi:prepilin-type N-terminal cleavage/methylation domain-containing protein
MRSNRTPVRSSNRQGFTLIELLIVVVIIGILAAVAIPKFSNTKEKAYVATMKSDLKNLVSTQESYFADRNVYGAKADVEGGTYGYKVSQGHDGRRDRGRRDRLVGADHQRLGLGRAEDVQHLRRRPHRCRGHAQGQRHAGRRAAVRPGHAVSGA